MVQKGHLSGFKTVLPDGNVSTLGIKALLPYANIKSSEIKKRQISHGNIEQDKAQFVLLKLGL